MFRPFLPCGIAYGFAYALPMLCLWLCLWHSMLFFRRKASRRVVCIVPYRRGACQPVSAEFRRHLPFSGAGGAPVSGGLLRRCRRGGRWRRPAGLNPSGTCSPCPGGEDHLKRRRRLRRIVPSPPVPPLLGCRHCSRESLSVGFTPYRRFPRRKENCMAGFISAACGSVQGCRGRSPRRNKL